MRVKFGWWSRRAMVWSRRGWERPATTTRAPRTRSLLWSSNTKSWARRCNIKVRQGGAWSVTSRPGWGRTSCCRWCPHPRRCRIGFWGPRGRLQINPCWRKQRLRWLLVFQNFLRTSLDDSLRKIEISCYFCQYGGSFCCCLIFEEKTISHLSQFPYSTKLSEPIHRNPQQSDREEKRT